MRQLFKGDNYSREETIRGNTVSTFFKADENEFRGAGNVKRIETSAQITSMKSKSSAAEAIGRTKKKRKKRRKE